MAHVVGDALDGPLICGCQGREVRRALMSRKHVRIVELGTAQQHCCQMNFTLFKGVIFGKFHQKSQTSFILLHLAVEDHTNISISRQDEILVHSSWAITQRCIVDGRKCSQSSSHLSYARCAVKLSTHLASLRMSTCSIVFFFTDSRTAFHFCIGVLVPTVEAVVELTPEESK